jgi:hypothetical protein
MDMHHDFSNSITHPRTTARYSKQVSMLEEVSILRFDIEVFLRKIRVSTMRVATSL